MEDESSYHPRLCIIRKWDDFPCYGFNLPAERGRAGQYIGMVDDGSPAQAAGMKEGDRIVEVNGTNIGNENHSQVVTRIKAAGDTVTLLLVDSETDKYFREKKVVVNNELPDVIRIETPLHRGSKNDGDTGVAEAAIRNTVDPLYATVHKTRTTDSAAMENLNKFGKDYIHSSNQTGLESYDPASTISSNINNFSNMNAGNLENVANSNADNLADEDGYELINMRKNGSEMIVEYANVDEAPFDHQDKKGNKVKME